MRSHGSPPAQADPALPLPGPDALSHSERVAEHLRAAVAAAGGWLEFPRYMEIALYAPGLGYYSAGARKLGPAGDFVTAPEISPLFGRTLARQVAQIAGEAQGSILEVGAGSGTLAATLLEELERMGALPPQYLILELSADLRERSRDTLAARVPHLLERVAWLNTLPPSFRGTVIGNEVLDAMPVHLVSSRGAAIDELGVACDPATRALRFAARPAGGELLAAVRALGLAGEYRTEIGFAARAFVRSLAGCLEQGVALFVDYGFPRAEYYHPQRRQGTLMCHYRHRAHDDPFFLPGLQDITAHVDFSAMAEAAAQGGLALAGYASQAQFLINCGITGLLAEVPAEDAARYLRLANQANRLLSPAEMGELFKVIAFARDMPAPLLGFASGDRRGSL